jgi:hypothetical protein
MDSMSAPGPDSFLGGITGGRVRRPDLSSAFVVSAGVALLYAALGLLTLRLGQMTGLASPAWPAAGVAFAAALWWRWRALPGVFIGSVGVNMYWLTRLGEAGWQTWFAAAAIGLGAVLGAAAGAGLVHRFVGPARRLDTPRAVMLTLALGGLVASTIAPTIGVTAQLTTKLLSTSEAAFGWLTWWVGDAIGVIVFAPLVLMFLPSQAGYWSGRRWKIAVPSLLIFAILMAAIMQNVALERTRISNAVEQLGDQAATDLAGNIALHQEVLEGLRGLLDASANVTSEEFDTFTNNVLSRFPNLAALSWTPWSPRQAWPLSRSFSAPSRAYRTSPSPNATPLATYNPSHRVPSMSWSPTSSRSRTIAALVVSTSTPTRHGPPPSKQPATPAGPRRPAPSISSRSPARRKACSPCCRSTRAVPIRAASQPGAPHCAASPSASTASAICLPRLFVARPGTVSA